MNFCTQCGTPLKPETRFCGKCGQVILEKPATPRVEPIVQHCRKCGSQLTAWASFCVRCGAPVSAEVPPAQPVQSTMTNQPNPGNNNADAITGVRRGVKKPKHRFLKVLFAVILLASGGWAALRFIKVPLNKEILTNTADSTQTNVKTENYQTGKVEDLAAAVEKIFAASDTAALAGVLSSTFLEQRRPYLGQLIPYMPAFAEDFKSRRLLYSNERYAVYEFSSAEGKFTVDFCLGEDGTWKIMRF